VERNQKRRVLEAKPLLGGRVGSKTRIKNGEGGGKDYLAVYYATMLKAAGITQKEAGLSPSNSPSA